MKYRRLLSTGTTNKVIALTEETLAKLFTGDTRSDIGSEAEKMKYVNSTKEWVSKFVALI